MEKIPFLVSVFTMLLSLGAEAQLVLPTGHYESTDGCTLKIERAKDGRTSFRVDKGVAYASGEIRNPILSRSEQVLAIGICRSSASTNLNGVTRRGSQVEFSMAHQDSYSTTFLTRCGGAMDAVDYRVYWTLSNYDNSLLALRAENLIAKYSTPGGYHSGPLKSNNYPLSCGKFSKVR